MNTIIKFYTLWVYGRITWYAADPEQAKAIYRITGQKTITNDTQRGLEKLGFTFEQVLPPNQ